MASNVGMVYARPRPSSPPATECRQVRTAKLCLCAATLLYGVILAAEPAHPVQLTFLVVGTTKRQDVSVVLGEPSARYPSDSIVTYRLRADGDGYRRVARSFEWHPATHSLVLQFDERGILLRYGLVRVR